MEMEMDSIVESYTDSDVEQVGHDVSSNFSYFPPPREQTDLVDALQSNNLSRYETQIETFPTREPQLDWQTKSLQLFSQRTHASVKAMKIIAIFAKP